MIIDGKVESSERKGKCLQVVKDNQSSLMSRELGFGGGGVNYCFRDVNDIENLDCNESLCSLCRAPSKVGLVVGIFEQIDVEVN